MFLQLGHPEIMRPLNKTSLLNMIPPSSFNLVRHILPLCLLASGVTRYVCPCLDVYTTFHFVSTRITEKTELNGKASASSVVHWLTFFFFFFLIAMFVEEDRKFVFI